jgi:hypothetical protein
MMPIKPGKLKIQPIYVRKEGAPTGTLVPTVMRPIFFDPHTNQIIDRSPQEPEKEKPFSDILKKK